MTVTGNKETCATVKAICIFFFQDTLVARSDLPKAYMHVQGGVKHPSNKPTMSPASEPGTNEPQ